MTFQDTAQSIGNLLSASIQKHWDGKVCILQMKTSGNRQWRQMEWIGFYFQFCCETYLESIMEMPGPKYGRAEFDGLLGIPWDFKAHAMNTNSHQIIVNDSEAIAEGIKKFGSVGLILALGQVIYNDENRAFQKWHQDLKGGRSKYEVERIERGACSRLRKTHFDLQQISFIEITDKTLVKCGSFQNDFRNSNGSPRRPKVLIDLERLQEETLHFIEF
jgi:hypothetical protein